MKYFLDQPVGSFRSTFDLPAGDPLLFAFQRGNLIVAGAEGTVPSRSDADAAGLVRVRATPLGVLGGRGCEVALVANDAVLPEGFEARSLRRLFGALEMDTLAVSALASQIAHFLWTHARCGSCGGPTAEKPKERAVRCDACDRDMYPAVAPCTIILVHDGPRVLLTRQPRFPKGMYGLVAGFVEPGESLEHCARREIAEEVGLVVTDLEYVASQPWPFPSQLMMGMTARYVSGDLTVDTTELEEAKWFDIDALPTMPPPFSIARHLLDLWIERVRGAQSESK